MASERNRATKARKELAKRGTAQRGVVSIGQIQEQGLSQRAASHAAQSGRFHRVHRGVYALGHGYLERLGQLEAALLACGETAVVSHQTAAAHWGLVDRWPVLIDVTVICETGRKIDGIRCRRCRYPESDEITIHEGVRCTTPARTLIDLAGLLGRGALRRAVERAAHLGLLDLDALVRALENAKGRRGVRALRTIIAPWFTDGGSPPDLRSDFEALVLPRLVEIGLPRPRCNAPLILEGRRLTIDFLWQEHRLAVETDGAATHDNPIAFRRDRWRDQLLVAAGYRAIRVTWDQMRDESEAIVARISRALRQSHP